MNSLNQSLADVIKTYTDYDFSNQSYHIKQLTAEEKQKIEVQLITIFSQFLTEKGVQDEQINHQRRILLALFHPDKSPYFSPEVRWLECALSNGADNGGFCFRLIDNCADELKQPASTEEDFVFESKTFNTFYIDDLIARLEKKRELAKTLTQRALIDSTITLLQKIKCCQTMTDSIDPSWLKIFLSSLPYMTSGFCIGLYLEELSLLYAALYVVAQSGSWLKKSDVKILQYLGNVAYEFSRAISNAATTLTFYFISMNFAAINTTYYLGIEACSKVYQLIDSVISSKATTNPANAHSQSLILAPQYFLPGKFIFETLELKLMALKLEQYQEQQKQQYFASWRKGCKKSKLIEQALQQFKEIDVKSLPTEQKLAEAEVIINRLASQPYFKENRSKAQETMEAVKVIIRSLSSNFNKNQNEQPRVVDEDYIAVDGTFFI
ncbi:Uncharacterised protein [Legionella beliardensis]|uniref:Uncharacterized protein n=1 Tax=Legionella beliardensis TaxID=91822 RepID=A0A378I0G5_9GAMM|nr:hypothetical protein [Legionella beliardensis]STX28241.1 Uncharacterised protein [Legionella beliardensis]